MIVYSDKSDIKAQKYNNLKKPVAVGQITSKKTI